MRGDVERSPRVLLSSVALAELAFGPEEKVGYSGPESLLQGDLVCVNPVAARHKHDHPLEVLRASRSLYHRDRLASRKPLGHV